MRLEALGPSSKRAKKEEAKESVTSGRRTNSQYWAAGEHAPVAARRCTQRDILDILCSSSLCLKRFETVVCLYLRAGSWVGG